MNEPPPPSNCNVYKEPFVVLERYVVYGVDDYVWFVVREIGINYVTMNN